ncbi:MAG: Mur ligase domain-containing protein [Candidatus Pacebacteria bacterium]|nr:Mur ligase domain-containing protein [Candidatus Paceibacterota bacterium]
MKVHFIGIGGIALSGIASIYKQKKWIVSGSDEEKSEITDNLKKTGIKVFIGHKISNIPPKTDLVIFSEAVPKSNPELKEARKQKIKCLSGAMALAELAQDYFLIAVSGMHGKSTTASMIANILIKAKLDPTFIIGTKPGSRLGKSKYLVIEADDYQAKFLNYYPDILVLTNIDAEHLDCLKNLSNIMKIFRQYVKQVKYRIIANKDNANIAKLLKNNQKTIFFSQKQKGDCKKLKGVLQVPGEHNVANALAALNAARVLGIKDATSLKALAEFKGIWRRFQESSFKIKNLKFKIVNDYAHHPTEIKATFQALKEKYSNSRIWVVFQPHQYQRTFYLFDDFVKIFQQAKNQYGINKVIITDIYSVKGRESQTIKKKVNSQKLVKVINRVEAEYLEKTKVNRYIKEYANSIDVLVIMGAGSIYRLIDELKN